MGTLGMNIKEVRKAVAKMKNRLFKRANSYSIGILKSSFRGTGLQFKEHRVYEVGDDIRFIDWKLLAKISDPYVKTFDEERNVEITVVIDAGPTMFMGSNGISKLQVAIEICCLLYLISEESKDFVHAIVFGKRILDIPKQSGERGISHLIYCLEKEGILTSSGLINLDYAHQKLVDEEKRHFEIIRHLSKKREVVILSDLNEFRDIEGLEKIFFRSHLNCFQIVSPIDINQDRPFLVYSKDNVEERGGRQRKVFFEGKRDGKKFLEKKVKRLNVEDRYLEKFIGEMV